MQEPISLPLALRFAWSTYREHRGLFVAIMLMFIGSWVALETGVIAGQDLGLPFWLVAHGVFFVLFATVEAGFLRICLSLHDRRDVSFVEAFASLRTGGRLLVGQILYGAMVLAGLVLFIIPGLYLAARYALHGFCLVPERMGLRSGLRESAMLGRGNEATLMAFLGILVLLNILGASLLGIGLFITVPISILMMTSAYRQLQGS